MECYKKKSMKEYNRDNCKKTNKIKPYDVRDKKNYNNDANKNYNASSNGESNKNRLKKCDENRQQQAFQSTYAPAAKRLLARRYPLTKDGKKYVEIGICIKNGLGHIEIALGEIFKKEVILCLTDWHQLILMKSKILDFFQSKTETVPMYINDELNIGVNKYNNIKLLYFRENDENCIVLAESSFVTLLKLKRCVSSQCSALKKNIASIDEKIEILSNVKDIKNCEDFDKTSIIDNEIVALYFN